MNPLNLTQPIANTTRLRIMLFSDASPRGRGSAGTGRQARLRTACRKAWGFESPLPQIILSPTFSILITDIEEVVP